MLALADLRDDAARCGVDDLGQHAVLDAEAPSFLRNTILVAGGENASPSSVLKAKPSATMPRSTSLARAMLIEHPHIPAQMGEDQRLVLPGS
jgi:hypothetical protein